MAASTLVSIPLVAFFDDNGSTPSARLEDFVLYDTSNTAQLDKHKRLAFNKADNVSPEAIYDFICPTTVTGTTGFTVVWQMYTELPIVAGNVYWGLSVQRVQAQTTSNQINTDSWGTETLSAITVAGTSGQHTKCTLAVTNANMGGGGASPVAGDIVRVRIRRLNTNVLDTCLAPVYITGSVDFQNT